MENTRNTQHGEGSERWPALPYEAWRETCQTLHLWTQIVGKVRKEGNMRTIGHEELKQKLDRQDHFRLVMALGEWAYQAKHIPGSIHFATMRDALHSFNKEDEIVVYCSDASCIASAALGQLLERNGYTHVLHYVGGLQEWEQAGYLLEGEWVKKQRR